MLTAHTFEMDDAGYAVREILEQLDIERRILKNSVGLIFCYLDFIESGVVEAVCKALPFDVVGCTTQGIAMHGAMGEDMLAVMVLTSDDVEFSTGFSEVFSPGNEKRIAAMYEKTAASLSAAPSLLMVFKSMLPYLMGEMVVSVLDRLAAGAPVFGTIALDMATGVRSPQVIYNGVAYSDCLVLLLFSGDVRPRFSIDSMPQKKIRGQQAVITAAEGNRMISVNNIPTVAYMERIGLINDGVVELLYAFPLYIDNHDGEKQWPCIIIDIGPDGSVLCGNSIRPGSTLRISSPLKEDVLASATNIIELAKQEQDRNGLLVFSCFSRNVALMDSHDEMKLVQKLMADSSLPYMFLYSGGEFCPHYGSHEKLINKFHQYSIISCIL
ncbi:MAG: FIST C-terminal domain-containing protein [Spirochaetaceae bacterium]|jgi:hypothetical protein|nr:FIST C-terminal domain-containing protein [Spirochaetaceae bacterium]